jgi:zinc transport system permease protein
MAYEAYAYNRLMFIGLNAAQAQTMGVWVRGHEYIFSCLLALVVMFSIKAVGVLLVTAMLVIPAAAARNLARSCGGLFWWGIVIATTSSVAGLILADHFSTAAGASTILCATAWFLGSSALSLSANR